MTDEYFQSIHRKDFKLPSKNFIHEQTRKLILPNLERFRAIEESNEHDVESYLLWAEKQGRGHRDNIHSSPPLFSSPPVISQPSADFDSFNSVPYSEDVAAELKAREQFDREAREKRFNILKELRGDSRDSFTLISFSPLFFSFSFAGPFTYSHSPYI
jgi:hypothetical protein